MWLFVRTCRRSKVRFYQQRSTVTHRHPGYIDSLGAQASSCVIIATVVALHVDDRSSFFSGIATTLPYFSIQMSSGNKESTANGRMV